MGYMLRSGLSGIIGFKVLRASRTAVMVVCATILMLWLPATSYAHGWQVQSVPLLTQWEKRISPEHLFNHYPRPLMRRPVWQNLDGLWHYVILPRNQRSDPIHFAGRILVPFPVESALSGVEKPLLPDQCIWYRRTVHLAWSGTQRTLLHIEASTWKTSVYVNGHLACVHRGSYTPITCDISRFLHARGRQTLLIRVWNPGGEQFEPRGKQTPRPHRDYFSESSGIWGTVWLEPVPSDYITHIVIRPDPQHNRVLVRTETNHPGGNLLVSAKLFDGTAEVSKAAGLAGVFLQLPVRHPRLWSPRHPFLYGLKVSIRYNGKIIDSIKSYVGIRTISVGPGIGGKTQILLNGKPLFERGLLYQGYWPGGLYTPPGDRAMAYDISTAKRLGFNMFRVHEIVEPRRFYYLADRLGYLIWQDMPTAWPPPDRHLTQRQIDRVILAGHHWWGNIGPLPAAAKAEYLAELTSMIRHLRNNPCIVVWTAFNEGWGIHDVRRITAHIRRLDPTRLVDADSGWNLNHTFNSPSAIPGDILDTHHYPGPRALWPTATKAAVCGEFGGIFYAVAGHCWLRNPQRTDPMAKAIARYRRLWAEVRKLRREKGISAVVYTEMMDQQQEIAGLLTFDRRLKFPARIIRDITLGKGR